MAVPSSPTYKYPFTLPTFLEDLPLNLNAKPADASVNVAGQEAQPRISVTDPTLPPIPSETPQHIEEKKNSESPQDLPTLDPKKTKMEGKISHSFSFRRNKSTSKVVQEDSDVPPMPAQARGNSFTMGEKKSGTPTPPQTAPGLKRDKSKRGKFATAIANPETLFARDPQSPPHESKYV